MKREKEGGRGMSDRDTERGKVSPLISFLSPRMRHELTFNTTTLISLALYSLCLSALLLRMT